MVRILHTADVHLTPQHPERLEALEQVLAVADDAAVDIVTVGGDLFDSERAAEQLRATLRDTLSDRSYPIVTIPGNHDVDAFRDDLFFGDAFTPLVEAPFSHYTDHDNDVRITGIPYTPQATDDLLVDLADRADFDGADVLLLHCSLEAPFSDRNAGDEAAIRYFPVERATLAELDFDYYLAGHFHSPHRVSLTSGGTFVYPGSPASITRSETGQRRVTLVDTDRDRVDSRTLESFHYDRLELTVTPGTEAESLADIETWTEKRASRNADISITVSGFIDQPEAEFSEDLAAAAAPFTPDNRTRNVEPILTHPLFQSFAEELDGRELPDSVSRDAVWTRTLRVFAELHAEGRLS